MSPDRLYFGAAAVVAIAGLLAVWFALRRMQRNATPARRVRQASVPFDERRCPVCRRPMEPGFCRPGQGILWFGRREPVRGLRPVFSAVPNTVFLELRPPVLRAWRCEDCRQMLIDHSEPLDPR